MTVKAQALSSSDLALFQGQLTVLSNARQSDDKLVAEQDTDDLPATELEPSASLG